MSVSTPFIRRPIATSLLAFAVMLGGWLGYWWLPVSSLPQVDFPTIQITANLRRDEAYATTLIVGLASEDDRKRIQGGVVIPVLSDDIPANETGSGLAYAQ